MVSMFSSVIAGGIGKQSGIPDSQVLFSGMYNPFPAARLVRSTGKGNNVPVLGLVRYDVVVKPVRSNIGKYFLSNEREVNAASGDKKGARDAVIGICDRSLCNIRGEGSWQRSSLWSKATQICIDAGDVDVTVMDVTIRVTSAISMRDTVWSSLISMASKSNLASARVIAVTGIGNDVGWMRYCKVLVVVVSAVGNSRA